MVADRSGNHYTITARVYSVALSCKVTKTEDKSIKLECNRSENQILRYEVYLNGELLTSTYETSATFTKAGRYKFYVQDIYNNVFTGSGVYYLREMSDDGVAVYAIYVDKEAPDVEFSKVDENGTLIKVPVDGVLIRDINAKELIIGKISSVECDRLSYVAVYKTSNVLTPYAIYTANALEQGSVKLPDGN